ncbi:hypothetical protein JW926_17430 [Candidatus Sumerlaeota bacterium]|nr:hypothetical protein [Candidatus Sumerlaeota bacterium]
MVLKKLFILTGKVRSALEAGAIGVFFFLILQTAPCVDLSLGRQANLVNPALWEKWPSGLANPSPGSYVEISGNGLRFAIPETAKEMIWRQSIRPAWRQYHHYLTITYQTTGISPTTFALVRLRTGYDAWFTAITSPSFISDGTTHTMTMNFSSVTSADQIVGVEIRLVSGGASGASFTMTQCDFTDHPPGYEFPPQPSPTPVSTGFELDVNQPAQWVPQPTWLSNPATNPSVTSTGSSLLLAINEPGKGMKWRNNSIGSQDTATYPYVLMHYRAMNLQNSSSNYALYLSGAGESRPFYLADLLDDGLWHYGFAPVGISTVNLMALQVQNVSSPESFLEIESLKFVNGDPRADISWFTSLEEGWDELTSDTALFDMVNLEIFFNAKADQLLPRMDMNVSWFDTNQLNAIDLIPFQVKTEGINLVSTSLPDVSPISIPIGKKASEVYFILGAWLPGREIPGSTSQVSVIDEMERLIIRIEYTDETYEEFFPVDIFSGFFKITNKSFSAFAVPADFGKTIESVSINDGTDGGLFTLAALTLNISGTQFYCDSFLIPDPPVNNSAAAPAPKSPAISYSENLLVLENTYGKMTFDLSSGFALKEWKSHYSGHNIIGSVSDTSIFSLKLQGTSYTSKDFSPVSVDIFSTGSRRLAEIALNLAGYVGALNTRLSIEIDEGAETRFDLLVENTGDTTYSAELLFPSLDPLTLGSDPDFLYYAYPQITFICDNVPFSKEVYYAGNFPMQFMDIFNPEEGWGVYLMVQDLELIHKYFGLTKDMDSASLFVRYPTLASTGIPPGEKMEIAPFVLGLHPGDWRQALKAYQDWTKTWYEPKSPRQSWFNGVYTCRRDYPISGTNYLLDRILNVYTFDKEISNAAQYLGGADFIDISSWGWSASSGRVGDYRKYELGGLENFRDGIAYSCSQNIPVGLYIEGYNIDDRSDVYAAHGEEWKLLNSLGLEIRNGDHEIVICPHPVTWQNHMKQLYKDVVSETGANAMYIDIFGMASTGRSCYRSDHGHRVGEAPLRGEFELTKKVREGLNEVRPGIPLYTEYTPVDVTGQYQDGSFSYTIWHGDPEISPTETNLYRFAFPDFKQIELVNGLFLAMNWTEEGVKKAFFNGEGLWIKGDLPSWYDERTNAFYTKSHEIFRDHRDALTSGTAEPFVNVLVGDVYSHRFAFGDKQIFMLYNANRRNVFADLIAAGSVSDAHVVDLWGETMLGAVVSEPDYKIHANLLPRDIGCVGIFKRIFDASYADGNLTITRTGNPSGLQLELVGVDGYQRRVSTQSDPGGTYMIDLRLIFDPLPETLIVKIKSGGIVLDEIILNDVKDIPEAGVSSWKFY